MTIKAACVLVLQGDLVLAVETRHRPGELSLPGGSIDPGETPAQAAAREALEETGLVVELHDAPLYTGPPGREPMEAATFLVRSFQGEPRPGSDAVAVRWVTHEALLDPRNRYAGYNREVLDRLPR